MTQKGDAMKPVTVSVFALTLVGSALSAAWARSAEPQPAPTPVVAAAPQVAPVPPAAAPTAPRAPRPSTGEPQAPPAPEAARAPRPRGQLANVRVDVTVTDQTGTGPAVTKAMTLTVADGESAMIRNETEMKTSDSVRSAPFSVDVRAVIDGDRVRLDVGLDYQVLDTKSTETPGPPTRALFKGRQSLVLESGKPLVISQSSDPMSDRKVTVEVKGTIIR
jgi:hypothetical protein